MRWAARHPRLAGWRERIAEAAHRARRGLGLRRLRRECRRPAASPTAVTAFLIRAALLSLADRGAGHAADATRSVRDDAGDTITVGAAPCRIVSLAPGTTAMLYAAGAGHCLVGTIAHSDEPAEAARVPVVGDAETLDFEQLLGLRPTVVVVAVDVVQRVRIDRIRALRHSRLPGARHAARADARIAAAARRARRYRAVANRKADELAAELAALDTRYRNRATVRVLYQIWDRPIYTIGGRHVITDALELCGADNIFADLETAAPAVTREAAVLRNPAADPRLGAAGCGRRLAGRVAQDSRAGRGARRTPGESRRCAHRSNGSVGHRGHRAICARSSTARANLPPVLCYVSGRFKKWPRSDYRQRQTDPQNRHRRWRNRRMDGGCLAFEIPAPRSM